MKERNAHAVVEPVDDDGMQRVLVFAGGQHLEGAAVSVIDCTVDMDPLEGILGIEVIGLRSSAGVDIGQVAASRAEEPNGVAISYDPDADAMYVRLKRGRALVQRTAKALVMVTGTGALAGIEVRLASR